MEYIYASQTNYEDFASGRVLYGAHGTTAFPVRLASEIIQRCFGLLQHKGFDGPYSLYDPCCGGGYLLTVIGLLHGRNIKRIFASDINNELVGIAERNLSLLTKVGISKREQQIRQLIELYNKPSHAEALKSIGNLQRYLAQSNLAETVCYSSDITALGDNEQKCTNVNIMLSDIPYGDIVSWKSDSSNPLKAFFDHAHQLLARDLSVLAVIADKNQSLKHERFRRLQYFKVGKRQVGIFEPIA